MRKILLKSTFLIALGAVIMVTSCNTDDDPVVQCTFLTDADCFCKTNAGDARCEDEVVCTFESDEECFCEANPTDAKCEVVTTASYMDDALLAITFEGLADASSIFQNGTTGGTWNGTSYDAWADANATVATSIQTEGAAEGDNYLAVDFDIKTAAWSWVANVHWEPESANEDITSLAKPHLTFAVKSADITEFQFQTAFSDQVAESGTGTALNLAISSDWTVYALPLDKLDYNWGSGDVDFSSLKYAKYLGLNINGKEVGDSFTLDIDAVGFISMTDLPSGAVFIDQSYLRNAMNVIDFEGLDNPTTVFQNGTTGGTWNGVEYTPWADANAAVEATIVNSGGNTGDSFLSVEVEVLTEGWAWTSNVHWEPDAADVDVTSLTDMHMVFAVKSDDITEFQFETAYSDQIGESGTNTGLNLAVTSDWTVYALPLTEPVWNWGTGTDWSHLKRIKYLGLNITGKAQGDIFVLGIDGVGLVSKSDLPRSAVIIEQVE